MIKTIVQCVVIIATMTLAVSAFEGGEITSAGFLFGVAMCCCVIFKATLDSQRGE